MGASGHASVPSQQADVGGQWALAYPGVTLQNTRESYFIPDFEWPFEPEQHPTGDEILRYMRAAVDALGLRVRCGMKVVSAVPLADDGGWRLSIVPATGGTPRTEDYDRLVLATGQYSEGKVEPGFVDQAAFTGAVVTNRGAHSHLVAGRAVVVVGAGKSALDVAVTAARRGCVVHHVFRTPRWLLPRVLFGVHTSYPIFARMGSSMVPSWTHPTGDPERPATLAQRVFWAQLEAAVAFAARRAAAGRGPEAAARVAAALPTDHGIMHDMRSAIALAPDDYFGILASGAITPHVGTIARCTAAGVELHLSDGSGTRAIPAVDVIVAALGCASPTFPALPPTYRSALEAHPDGAQLYRHVVHPALSPRTLAFGGFNHGFLHIPSAAIGALWVGAV